VNDVTYSENYVIVTKTVRTNFVKVKIQFKFDTIKSEDIF